MSVDSTTTITRIPILTFKSYKPCICRRFWRPNHKMNSSILLWYYDILSLTFNSLLKTTHSLRISWRLNYATDIWWSHAAQDAVSVHWTWTRVRHTHKRCAENQCNYSWNMKTSNKLTDQLSHWPLPDESNVFRPDINFNKLINDIYTNKAKNNKETNKKHYVQIQSRYTSVTLRRVVIIKRQWLTLIYHQRVSTETICTDIISATDCSE